MNYERKESIVKNFCFMKFLDQLTKQLTNETRNESKLKFSHICVIIFFYFIKNYIGEWNNCQAVIQNEYQT